MRHNHKATRFTHEAEPGGQARADVARMHDDELLELVGSYPLSDAPDADSYFEEALRELVRRLDGRREPAGAGA